MYLTNQSLKNGDFFFENGANFQCSLFMQATRRNGTVLSFYSMPEYESWKESLNGNASGWSIKYYKVCLFDMEEKEFGYTWFYSWAYQTFIISVIPSWSNIVDVIVGVGNKYIQGRKRIL